jgi:hypothetical protein
MTYIILWFALPALFAGFMLAHRLVQVQSSEPVETVVLDRTAVVKRLLSKAAGAGLVLLLGFTLGCTNQQHEKDCDELSYSKSQFPVDSPYKAHLQDRYDRLCACTKK